MTETTDSPEGPSPAESEVDSWTAGFHSHLRDLDVEYPSHQRTSQMHIHPTRRVPSLAKFLTGREMKAALGKITEYRQIFEAQQKRLYEQRARLTGKLVPLASNRVKLHWTIKELYEERNWPLEDGERTHLEWTREEMDHEMASLELKKRGRDKEIRYWEQVPDGALRDEIEPHEELADCSNESSGEPIDRNAAPTCPIHGYPHRLRHNYDVEGNYICPVIESLPLSDDNSEEEE